MQPRGISLDGNLLPPTLVGVMVLLDRSGSMSSICASMEQQWTEFIAEQQAAQQDGMWVSVHQFDGEGYDVTCDRTPLAQVGSLGLHPRGSTPLRDALYRFLTDARAVVDDANDPTQRLLLVIITDGGENASRTATWAQVREALQGLSTTDCETIWLGTTAAIVEAQHEMPVFAQAGASTTYSHTEQGVAYAATAMHVATRAMRSGESARGASASFARMVNESGLRKTPLKNRIKDYDELLKQQQPDK